jgi:small subunit ribosomal protein S8
MSMNDPLSDMLTRIRNGQQANLAFITCPASNLLEGVLNVLKHEGYIREYSREADARGHSQLRVELKYHDGEPVIREIKRVSRPGRRRYSAIKQLNKVHNGLGIAILTTSHGIMSDNDARQANLGGEVLCQVF